MEQSGREFKVFSERYGYRLVRDSLQYEQLDEETRNRLWNVIRTYVPSGVTVDWDIHPRFSPEAFDWAVMVWDKYFKKPIDTIPTYYDEFLEEIRRIVLDNNPLFWFRTLDILEILMHFWRKRGSEMYTGLIEAVDRVLIEEKVAHRVVEGLFVPITDEAELRSIEEAIEESSDPVTIHLNKSLRLLCDRQTPDYENSIKESISAVEAIVRITQGNKGTLGKLIDSLGLHPHLAEAFKKLYHYTSDEEGIRHSFFSGDQKVDFDEAKLMLVLCSAFVNYVRTKQSRIQQSDKSEADPGP